ncbi:hypothetical protein LCGC14_1750480 [marine sediment metagenome]|uniref:DUF4190 domain-containing protein n=1 Tax=marine sediment metagenome TaxID=412755 RepID=A0A0F9K3K4_9ZZZZ|nr:DUF4190 domain-containing protein [Actinomycetota bacterium]
MAEENNKTPEVPPQPSQPVAPKQSASGLAVASLVLGIIGIIMICCCYYLAGPLGIVAWVLGQIERNNIKRGESPQAGMGMATAGWILGIITTALFALFLILAVIISIFDIGLNLPLRGLKR